MSSLHAAIEHVEFVTETTVAHDTGPLELIYGRDEAGEPKAGLRIVVHACSAHDCPCREVQLDIEPMTRVGRELVPAGRRYTLGVDVDTMEQRAIRMEPADGDDEKVLAALRRELRVGSSLQADLKDRLALHRGDWGAPASSFDFREAEQGVMVRFSELFPDSQATLLRHGGARYFIDDDWCARSSCDCAAGLVHLYRLIEGDGPSDDAQEATPTEYVGTTNYPISVKEPLPPDLVALPDDIVAALRTPTLKRLLETRRNAVRQAARAHFDAKTPRVSSVKVGRNDPCPCGSGKKHKKCCQRANA